MQSWKTALTLYTTTMMMMSRIYNNSNSNNNTNTNLIYKAPYGRIFRGAAGCNGMTSPNSDKWYSGRTLSAHFGNALAHIMSISKLTTNGGELCSMALRCMNCTRDRETPSAVATVDQSGPSCLATSRSTSSVIGSLVGR